MMTLKKSAKLAVRVLNKNTKYQRDKRIISSVFSATNKSKNKVVARLSLIDCFYTTLMNNRLWGIEDIASQINSVSKKDSKIKELALDFAARPVDKSPIYKLINGIYGIKKDGTEFGKASPIVTKYLYFLTNYRFPIFDNSVKISYRYLRTKYPNFELNELTEESDINYFISINALNQKSKIGSYDRLNKLLWLLGKIRKGSFSQIFSKDKYLQLVNLAGADEISDYLQTNIHTTKVQELLGDNFCSFFDFVSNLEQIT
jgi:hypothetical protein